MPPPRPAVVIAPALRQPAEAHDEAAAARHEIVARTLGETDLEGFEQGLAAAKGAA